MIAHKARQAYAVLKALPVGARAAIGELTRPRRNDDPPKPPPAARSRAKSGSAKPKRRARATTTAKKTRKSRGRA